MRRFKGQTDNSQRTTYSLVRRTKRIKGFLSACRVLMLTCICLKSIVCEGGPRKGGLVFVACRDKEPEVLYQRFWLLAGYLPSDLPSGEETWFRN